MPVGRVNIGSAKAGHQTKFPWSWLCADYSADGNPWLPALKCVSDFMRAGDYSQRSFWNSHRGEGQGQVSPRRFWYCYWNSQKVCLGSSVLSCGKTQTNFLDKPIDTAQVYSNLYLLVWVLADCAFQVIDLFHLDVKPVGKGLFTVFLCHPFNVHWISFISGISNLY